MFNRHCIKRISWLGAACFALTIAALGTVGARKADEKAAVHRPSVMILLALPIENDRVTLLAWGQPSPFLSTLNTDTDIEGNCTHCNLPMKFKAGEAAKRCAVCPCGAVYTECLTGKTTKHNRWDEMLQALPRGAALRVTFVDPDKPDAGISRLNVDLRTVLLPLQTPLTATDAELLSLVKPLGGTSVERADDGKRLLITLKTNWTAEREARLEKAVAKLGGVVDFAPSPMK